MEPKLVANNLFINSAGKVHLVLREFLDTGSEDHYEWNKVTTCVHNLFGGGQRWVDQYGEMIIRNTTNGLMCKLSFVRVSILSTYEIRRHRGLCNSN